MSFVSTRIVYTTSGSYFCSLATCSKNLLRIAVNVARENLVSIGTKFGRFNKKHKFRLHITALDFLAQYAQVG